MMATVQATEHYIDITQDICGGRPRITGTRMTVADVALMRFQMNQSLEEIAGTYDLPLAAVYSAMAYYFDHREEIDQRSAQNAAFVEDLRQQYPSKLQAKLNMVRPHSA